jgi:F-type H+-transporting ATPase subunit delta
LADAAPESGPIVSGIAGRYASALFELAADAQRIPAVRADLERFGAMIAESADLRRLVKSPAYTAGEQVSAVSALLEKAAIGGLAANFIKLVASKRRLFAVEGMITAFAAMADARAGVVKAEVTVAEPLSDRNRQAVSDALNAVTGKTVSFKEKVDPGIIGGLIVKMGSRMVDSSVRTKLNSLKIAMKEAV